MIYLELKDITEIQCDLIARSGGASGLLSQEKLESAIHRPKQSLYGKEMYPTIEEKASILMHGLCCFHAFQDGNKRIASLGMLTFLKYNGHTLIYGFNHITDKVLEFASSCSDEDIDSRMLSWIQEGLISYA